MYNELFDAIKVDGSEQSELHCFEGCGMTTSAIPVIPFQLIAGIENDTDGEDSFAVLCG